MNRLVLALLLVSLLPGCIRRYEAPREPVDPTTPYSALALYRQIEPPIGVDGTPLPTAALRVATDGGGVFADAALVDGPENPAITETWAGAVALLRAHEDAPAVLIADETVLGAACTALGSMTHRLVLAVRTSHDPLHPMKAQDVDAVSRDPLRGIPLRCPEVVAEPDDAEMTPADAP
ncbi:MAG: hypothetical protein KDA24_22400 [Deltaproteobacteria bacterium]|nr:hypothetical protein [Deltaproteobacteria bacterium]